ncbi:MAG: hypothetical protein WC322_06190, partial [Candidatus Paceibacterota bacterium]
MALYLSANGIGGYRRDEEEEKRQLIGAQQTEPSGPVRGTFKPNIGIGVGIGAAQKQPETVGVGVGQGAGFKINFTSSGQLRARAQEALAETLSRQPSEPLQEYMQMEQTYGSVGARRRIKDCTNLYNTYYSELDGPNIVWGLASSPYTISELEEMSKEAYRKLFSKEAKEGPVLNSPWLAQATTDVQMVANVIPAAVQETDNPMNIHPSVRITRSLLGAEGENAPAAAVDQALYDELDNAMSDYQATGSDEAYEKAQEATNALVLAEEQVALLNLTPNDVVLLTAKEYDNMTPDEQKQWEKIREESGEQEEGEKSILSRAWTAFRVAKPATQVNREDWLQRVYIMNGYPRTDVKVAKNVDRMLWDNEITADEYSDWLTARATDSLEAFEGELNKTGRSLYYTDEELADKIGAPEWREPLEGIATPAQNWAHGKEQMGKDLVFNTALLAIPVPRAATLCKLAGNVLRGGEALAAGARTITAIERLSAAEMALTRAGEYTRGAARFGRLGQMGRNLVEPLAAGGVERMAARRVSNRATAEIEAVAAGRAAPGLMALNAKFMGALGLTGTMSGEAQREVAISEQAYDFMDLTEEAQTGSQKMIAAIQANVYTQDLQGDRASIAKLQEWLQSTDGGKPALGLDLGEPNGLWDHRWDDVLEMQASWERRTAMELQMQMATLGYVGPDVDFADGTIMEDDTGGMMFVVWNDELNQFVEHPEWTEAFYEFQAEQAKQSDLAMVNPTLWYWLNGIGDPLTSGGWKSKGA